MIRIHLRLQGDKDQINQNRLCPTKDKIFNGKPCEFVNDIKLKSRNE